MYGKRYIFLNQ